MWKEFQLGGYDQQQFEWVQQTCLAVCPKQEQSYIETKQPATLNISLFTFLNRGLLQLIYREMEYGGLNFFFSC